MKRVLTALLLIPLVGGINFFAPAPILSATLMLAALLCLREFFAISDQLDLRPFRLPGYGAGALLVVAPELPQPGFFVGFCLLLLVVALQPPRPLSASLGSTASTLLGLVYVCGPFALAREIHGFSPHWLFFVLLMSWVGDSAAFYVGRAAGRHPLAPRVSPKKTWEGALASILFSVPAGAAYLLYFEPEAASLLSVVWISLATNVAGQVGDLAESALKRSARIKDSGALLPGHGGMLDRLDSFLFSAPTTYFCLLAMR